MLLSINILLCVRSSLLVLKNLGFFPDHLDAQFPPWCIYSFPFLLPILITLFLILEVMKVRPELSFKIYAYVIHLSYQTSFKNQVNWVLRGVESRSWIEKKKITCLGYINTYIYIFHSQELVFIMKELITLYFSYCLSDLASLLLSAISHLWQLHPPLWIAEWVRDEWTVDSCPAGRGFLGRE